MLFQMEFQHVFPCLNADFSNPVWWVDRGAVELYEGGRWTLHGGVPTHTRVWILHCKSSLACNTPSV